MKQSIVCRFLEMFVDNKVWN